MDALTPIGPSVQSAWAWALRWLAVASYCFVRSRTRVRQSSAANTNRSVRQRPTIWSSSRAPPSAARAWARASAECLSLAASGGA